MQSDKLYSTLGILLYLCVCETDQGSYYREKSGINTKKIFKNDLLKIEPCLHEVSTINPTLYMHHYLLLLHGVKFEYDSCAFQSSCRVCFSSQGGRNNHCILALLHHPSMIKIIFCFIFFRFLFFSNAFYSFYIFCHCLCV